MFENLTDRLNHAFRNVVGRAKLTDENMQTTLTEVKHALVEADVAYNVVKAFVKQVREKSRGVEVKKGMTPGHTVIKIINDELVNLMGDHCADLNLKSQPPAVILMAGLQGSGKTTTTAKLAKWLKEKKNKKVLMASVDIYRPAAIHQLRTLANEVGVAFFEAGQLEAPIDIAKAAIKAAKQEFYDVVLVDTAGRLHIDDNMMAEIKAIHKTITPVETLFVVDGMTGQDAAIASKHFGEAIELTGVIVTKLDGDARGGAVLSIRQVTGKPIKFIGVGEKIEALEPFYPDRIASRILGMGDILSLVEELEEKVDKVHAEKLAKKLEKGKGFDLEDFRQQLIQMDNMGGMKSMMDKMPGMGAISQQVKEKANDKAFQTMLVIINSMTLKERQRPILINGSRKRRIAKGSGTDIPDVNRLLKQYNQMQKMMQKMGKKGGLSKMIRSMQAMAGKGGGMGSF
ncbi:MAG TPA: signal recognition particle protein [Gammaproteobacteria bacterium]|nr:signal recognition particle protein [Gammaproteobacteria bacterium]